MSYAGALQSFSFDLGNTTTYRELVGGSKEVLITDRAASGSVSIEAVLMATKDYFAAAVDDDAALGNLQFTHGNVAGNIVQFTSSKVDIGDVAYGDWTALRCLRSRTPVCRTLLLTLNLTLFTPELQGKASRDSLCGLPFFLCMLSRLISLSNGFCT